MTARQTWAVPRKRDAGTSAKSSTDRSQAIERSVSRLESAISGHLRPTGLLQCELHSTLTYLVHDDVLVFVFVKSIQRVSRYV